MSFQLATRWRCRGMLHPERAWEPCAPSYNPALRASPAGFPRCLPHDRPERPVTHLRVLRATLTNYHT